MEEELFDFWKFLAGIGIFLWGMHQLEASLKELGGKSFKKLLQKSTNTNLKGILIGTLITAVLQSSSVVTLMVLAFLGAGVLTLKNSIGIILGANLGTTVTAWIVATLGFKLSVADFSMPFLGIGALLFVFATNRPILRNIGVFGVGFGLLFLGLDFMKTSIEAVANQIDLKQFDRFGLVAYLLIGLVVTALIQSSSAMIVIILSAISAGVIGLTEGAVINIGANIGTTIKVGIGSLGGSADKKRLALAHFLFNVITGLLVFIFIRQLIEVTLSVFSIDDPLLELVLINSLINLIGILLFLPFLSRLEKWLKHRFASSDKEAITLYIHRVSPKVPEAALPALEKEIAQALVICIQFITSVWSRKPVDNSRFGLFKNILRTSENYAEIYQKLKSLEDELTQYYVSLQEQNLTERQAQRLISLMMSLRMMVYAAKDIKDISHNIKELEIEDDKLAKHYYRDLRDYTFQQLTKIKQMSELESVDTEASTPTWVMENDQNYKLWINKLYSSIIISPSNYPVSTLTNVIKQVVSSLDNLSQAILHWKFEKKEVID